MSLETGLEDIDFTIDTNNLYREESIIDPKSASIRQLVPIKADGSEDPGRQPIFVGSSQLMTEEGPLPIQARLQAATLAEAYEEYPQAMKKAFREMVSRLQQAYQQQQQKQQRQESSRIIVPGR